MSIVMTGTFFICFHGNNGFFKRTLEDLWWRVQIVRESCAKYEVLNTSTLENTDGVKMTPPPPPPAILHSKKPGLNRVKCEVN